MAAQTSTAIKTFGSVFSNEEGYVKLTWDQAVDGGEADDSVRIGQALAGVVVTRAIVHVETACAGASGTAIIGIEGGDTDAFLDVTSGAVANLTENATFCETLTCFPYIAADSYVAIDIATTDFSAGKIHVHLWYVNA